MITDVVPFTAASGLSNHRFSGVAIYGGGSNKDYMLFDEAATSAQSTGLPGSANQFDTRRLRPDGSGPSGRSLVNITSTTCSKSNGLVSCSGPAASSDEGATKNGWFREYSTMDEKGATAPLVTSNCVLWRTQRAQSTAGSCGGAGGISLTTTYQADYITGTPSCADGFLNPVTGVYTASVSVASSVPPSEIVRVASRNSKTGALKISVVTDPDKKPIDVKQSADKVKSIYEIRLDRREHNCRHMNGAFCRPSSP
jgi:hypothetical protein